MPSIAPIQPPSNSGEGPRKAIVKIPNGFSMSLVMYLKSLSKWHACIVIKIHTRFSSTRFQLPTLPRTALLQDEHEVDDEDGKHVPKHRSLKPSGGILKGSNEAAFPVSKSTSAAAQMSLDPKMQQGVVRVKDSSRRAWFVCWH